MVKIWLCGDAHTGTTYFYELFLNLAVQTGEHNFTTTATKEFQPNHWILPEKYLRKQPREFKNRFSKYSRIFTKHENFIYNANQISCDLMHGIHRLEEMLLAYKNCNLLISEPTSFTFGNMLSLFDKKKFFDMYNSFLQRNDIYLLFIIRNPMDLENSRFARIISRLARGEVKNKAEQKLIEYLKEKKVFENIDAFNEGEKGELEVDYLPPLTKSRNPAKSANESYYAFYADLIDWERNCSNINIATYENIFENHDEFVLEVLSLFGINESAKYLDIIDRSIGKVNQKDFDIVFSDTIRKRMKSYHLTGIKAWQEIHGRVAGSVGDIFA